MRGRVLFAAHHTHHRRNPMRTLPGPRRALRVALTAALAVGGTTACSDPFEPEAFFETSEGTFTVHSLNGSAPSAPAAALLVESPVAVRIGSSFTFDFAVDFTSAGVASLLPVDVVASPAVVSAARYVGFQIVEGQSYDQLLLAPTGGYTYDAPFPVEVGDVGYIQSGAHPLCLARNSFTPIIYAKFRVDAIDPVARTVRMTVRSDPNCGFRELETGIPGR
jgi:hypothetical protein